MIFEDDSARKAEFRLRAMDTAKALYEAIRVSVLSAQDVHQRMASIQAHIGTIENAVYSRMEESFALGQKHPEPVDN